MEKIEIKTGCQYFHENLGITNERADELEEIISDLTPKSLELGFMERSEEGISVKGEKVLDYFLNVLAQDEIERLFLMMHVHPFVEHLGNLAERAIHAAARD